MSEIVVAGSLNADLVARTARCPEAGETALGESFATHCGGKGANQAYAAALLGASVAMLGRVGDDSNGRAQLRNLEAAGVSTEGARTLSGATTGVALIIVDGVGENRIVVVPGANAAFTPVELERERAVFERARFALFQLESPIETVARGLSLARAAGATTLLDPAPAQALSDAVLSLVDYLTPNLRELRALEGGSLKEGRLKDRDQERVEPGLRTGFLCEGAPLDWGAVEAAARRLLDRGVGKVLAKLGAAGALLVTPGGATRFEGFAVEAVDTTAAGDCFNGAFAAALARGEAEETAARFACAAAALSVTRAGAQPSMPTRAEVEAFLESRK